MGVGMEYLPRCSQIRSQHGPTGPSKGEVTLTGTALGRKILVPLCCAESECGTCTASQKSVGRRNGTKLGNTEEIDTNPPGGILGISYFSQLK
jgi:hypothetical protein